MGGPLSRRIYFICYQSTRLREVITRDLLPSSAMVRDLSQELGLPISQDDLEDGKLMVLPSQHAPCLERFLSRKSTLAYEIQAHRDKYLRWRNTMVPKNKGQEPNLIQVGALSPPWVKGPRPLFPPGLCSHLPGDTGSMTSFVSPGILGRLGKEYGLQG